MAEPDFVDFLRGMRVAQEVYARKMRGEMSQQERKELQRRLPVTKAAHAEVYTAMRTLNVAIEPDLSKPWGAWDEVRMFAWDFLDLLVTWDRVYVWGDRHRRFLS